MSDLVMRFAAAASVAQPALGGVACGGGDVGPDATSSPDQSEATEPTEAPSDPATEAAAAESEPPPEAAAAPSAGKLQTFTAKDAGFSIDLPSDGDIRENEAGVRVSARRRSRSSRTARCT